MHTSNYFDTFIAVAPDTSAVQAMVPPARTRASVAELTYRLIAENPYRYTSDDVIFTVWADRRDIPEARRPRAREEFFSQGQACLRSSDLGKRYGWGVHSNDEGRVALIPLGSAEYERLASGATPAGVVLTVTQAMRSSRG